MGVRYASQTQLGSQHTAKSSLEYRLRLHFSLHHAEQYVSCGATVKVWFCNIKQCKSAAEDTAWQDI